VDQNVERQWQVLRHQCFLGDDEVLVGYGNRLDLDPERLAEVPGEAFGDGRNVARGREPEGRPSGQPTSERRRFASSGSWRYGSRPSGAPPEYGGASAATGWA